MSFPFRQIHLDFHTAPDIPGVGSQFSADDFRRTLEESAVDSITLFSLCHHGYSYHPTKVGRMHPSLHFDLLGEQIKAAKAAGVRTQIYISAGTNQRCAIEHPQWREVPAPGVQPWSSEGLLKPGFHKLCFNHKEYLEHLCALTSEAVERYPDADGVFFDIIFPHDCCCQNCIDRMYASGLDPEKHEDRLINDLAVLDEYCQAIGEAVRSVSKDIAIIHNWNNVHLDHPEFLRYFSHLEIESLPTGGWGYDHFPLNAGAARKTGLRFCGMTGKFHSSWGEFGGIKHPNALRYECAAILAQGARCNIGDQLHPCGKMDDTTYRVIGEAYREVRDKEKYCEHAVNRAEIAMISAEACGLPTDSDIGLSRLLLESHFLFDVLLPGQDFSQYRAVIFPEGFKLLPDIAERIRKYLVDGGRVVFAGECIRELPQWLTDGIAIGGSDGLTPVYMLPEPGLRPEFASTPFVVYGQAVDVKPDNAKAKSLGQLYKPYYNRTARHFCSHRQTPYDRTPSEFSAGAISDRGAFLAMSLFSIYRHDGSVVVRQFTEKLINSVLGGQRIATTNLPSTARLTVTDDAANHREIVHLLYAPTSKRGDGTEIIEDLPPLHGTRVRIRTPHAVTAVKLVPQESPIDFAAEPDGVSFQVDAFQCHQMVALEYGE